MNNLLILFLDNSFSRLIEKIWNLLTSRNAILVYAIVVLILLVVLIIFVLAKDRVSKDFSKRKTGKISTYAIEKKIDEKLTDFNNQLKMAGTTKVVVNGNTNPSAHDATFNEEGEEVHSESRFYMLTQIDKEMEYYKPPKYNNEISLKDFCDKFREFSAGKLKLYYDIEDIRRFIGALAVTKLIVLQGMSGTGKTSLAYAFGEFLQNTTTIIPIQPMWKERTDLVGYYNEFTKKFNETPLLNKMYQANYTDDIYITVLDEMNIARIEYYFAEFLSLLEIPNLDGRNLEIVSDKWDNDPVLLKKGTLRLPPNMWFIGTANNDDSTFAISDKVYDRAMVLNLDKKAKVFEVEKCEHVRVSSTYLQTKMKEAQEEFALSDRNLRRIKKLDEYMIKTFHLTFGNRIMKQIQAYVPVLVACGGSELQALDDILSRKVFRKLEAKNPVYVKQESDALCNFLDDLFGIDKMPLSKEAIRTIEQNM
ncbi:MAG: AAA family ATPase [Bacilli bacterium]